MMNQPIAQPAVTVSTGPSRSLISKLISGVMILGLLVFWVIFLAGTAASQQACVDGAKAGADAGVNIDINSLLGRKLLSRNGRNLLGKIEDTCSNVYSLPMWIVWFQFINMILAILLSLSSRLTNHFGTGVAILFAINTGLLMSQAADYNSVVFENKDSNINEVKKLVSAGRAAMAGMIPIMILNIIYIIAATERKGVCAPGLIDVFPDNTQQASNSQSHAQQHFPQDPYKPYASVEMGTPNQAMPPAGAAPYTPSYTGAAPVYHDSGYGGAPAPEALSPQATK